MRRRPPPRHLKICRQWRSSIKCSTLPASASKHLLDWHSQCRLQRVSRARCFDTPVGKVQPPSGTAPFGVPSHLLAWIRFQDHLTGAMTEWSHPIGSTDRIVLQLVALRDPRDLDNLISSKLVVLPDPRGGRLRRYRLALAPAEAEGYTQLGSIPGRPVGVGRSAREDQSNTLSIAIAGNMLLSATTPNYASGSGGPHQ